MPFWGAYSLLSSQMFSSSLLALVCSCQISAYSGQNFSTPLLSTGNVCSGQLGCNGFIVFDKNLKVLTSKTSAFLEVKDGIITSLFFWKTNKFMFCEVVWFLHFCFRCVIGHFARSRPFYRAYWLRPRGSIFLVCVCHHSNWHNHCTTFVSLLSQCSPKHQCCPLYVCEAAESSDY